MGFSFKDILKTNPVTAQFIPVIDPAKKALGGIFGAGRKRGETNPFTAPDYSNVPGPLESLRGIENVYGRARSSATDPRASETDALNRLLQQIGQDTRQQQENLFSTFGRRGLIGPGGVSSDIATVPIAQAGSAGEDRMAAARLQFALDQIARERAFEEQRLRDYVAAAMQEPSVALARLGGSADLYRLGEERRLQTEQPSYLDSILRNLRVGLNFGPASLSSVGAPGG